MSKVLLSSALMTTLGTTGSERYPFGFSVLRKPLIPSLFKKRCCLGWISLLVSLVGVWLALQGCAVMTAPVATAVFGGVQLAIKGVELHKEIKKADVQEALDVPFEKTWLISIIVLANLDIRVARSERNLEEDGGIIKGLANEKEVKVVVAKLTEKITEIGIWADHDKALAALIAEKIKEEAQRQDNK